MENALALFQVVLQRIWSTVFALMLQADVVSVGLSLIYVSHTNLICTATTVVGSQKLGISDKRRIESSAVILLCRRSDHWADNHCQGHRSNHNICSSHHSANYHNSHHQYPDHDQYQYQYQYQYPDQHQYQHQYQHQHQHQWCGNPYHSKHPTCNHHRRHETSLQRPQQSLW